MPSKLELLQQKMIPGGADFEEKVMDRVNALRDMVYQNKHTYVWSTFSEDTALRFAELELAEKKGELSWWDEVEYESLRRIIFESGLEIDLQFARDKWASQFDPSLGIHKP